MLRFRRGGAYRAPEWTSSADRAAAPRPTRRGDDERVLGSPSRRALFAEGVLAAASDAALPFLPIYLVALGASTSQVGLLAAATALAGLLALLPAAWLARRARSRKAVVLLGSWGFARLALLPIAALPFIGRADVAVGALIALGGVRVLATSLSHPSWMALFADVVPTRLTGVFNARRSLAASVTGMALVPLAGWTIAGFAGLEGYQWIFLAGAALGVLGILAVSRVQEPACPTPRPRQTAYRKAFRDGRFRRYLLAMLVLHGFSTISGPFVIVHMVRTLGASPAEVGMLATSESIAAVAGQLAMSVLVVRFSSRQLFVLAIAGIAAAPVAWVLIAEPWQALLPVLIGGAAWAICHLAVFNLLLEYAPREDLPEYVAAQQLAMLGVGFVGPLVGAWLVASWGIVPLFLVAAAGRLLAIPIFLAPIPAGLRHALALWRLRARYRLMTALGYEP
ncbi:MAG: MFS transporter [Dehalococcoidia bacterium]